MANKFNLKKTVITYAKFLDERPDMFNQDESSVQTAINMAAVQLDAVCHGLIQKVWDYNMTKPENSEDLVELEGRDPNNDLYRTDSELDNIREAFIAQVHFTINLGNDQTTGSENMSMNGMSISNQRSVENKTFAPNVLLLLEIARVYQVQQVLNMEKVKKENNPNPEYTDYDTKSPTFNEADRRYLLKYQRDVPAGRVAITDIYNNIGFENPQNINFGIMQADRIKDPTDRAYKEIDKVIGLLFKGEGLNNGLTRGEIQGLIEQAHLNYDPTKHYIKDTIISYAHKETEQSQVWMLSSFLCLISNTGQNPLEPKSIYWKELSTADIDINAIVEEVIRRVDGQLAPEIIETLKEDYIPQEIARQLSEWETSDEIIFHKDTYDFFDTGAEFDVIRLKYNLTEGVDYEFGEGGYVFSNPSLSTMSTQPEINNIRSDGFPNRYNISGYFAPNPIDATFTSGIVGGVVNGTHDPNGNNLAFQLIKVGNGVDIVNTNTYVGNPSVNLNPPQAIPMNMHRKQTLMVKWLKDIKQKVVIVREGGGSDVDKNYVDQQDTLLRNRIDTNKTLIDTNTQDITNLGNTLDTAETAISTLESDMVRVKPQVETNKTNISALNTNITELTGKIEDNETAIGTNTSDIWTLNALTTTQGTSISANERQIDRNKRGLDSARSRVTNLETKVNKETPTADGDLVNLKYFNDNSGGGTPTNMVTTDTDQTITGAKTLEGETTFADIIWSNRDVANGKIKLETGSAAGFIEFFHSTNNTRFAVIGRTSSSNQHLTIETFDNKNLVLKSSGGISVNKPIAGIAPTADDHLATKRFVLDNAGGGGGTTAVSFNTEYSAGYTLDGNDVYYQVIKKGDPYASTITDISSSGTLVSGVQYFIGIEFGIIVRGSNKQIHNINAVTNSPDAHASIIYQTGSTIQYWFNGSMTLSDFKNKPFIAKVLYTKS